MILRNYINGELTEPLKNRYLEVIEPATGLVFAQAPDSGKEDINLAVEAAKTAFKTWSVLSAEKRFTILNRISELIDQNLGPLSELESKDNGKPVWLARQVDIPRAAQNMRFFATAGIHFAAEAHSMPGDAINYTLRQPLGVVGCISPWNLPLYLFTWKIAPALASGNCVVAKPSEITPCTAAFFQDLCIEAGLPPGVLNIVHGTGPNTGQAIVEHPDVKAVSFTGGTQTGAKIAALAGSNFKKLSLELGGKNPVLIFNDCNFEEMLATTVRSSFANQGEICLCGSRIYVEKGLYSRFKEEFVKRVVSLKVGDPLLQETKVGAIVSGDHKQKILHYIDLAIKEGGTILAGGKEVIIEGRCQNGFFIEPTVIEGLSNNCRTNQEEIFGPVVTIQPFESEEEAVTLANDSKYGLAATIWTGDLTRAHRLAEQVSAGIIWINCWLHRDLRTPFGGVRQSGLGREGGWEAMRFFTEPKNVCIKF